MSPEVSDAPRLPRAAGLGSRLALLLLLLTGCWCQSFDAALGVGWAINGTGERVTGFSRSGAGSFRLANATALDPALYGRNASSSLYRTLSNWVVGRAIVRLSFFVSINCAQPESPGGGGGSGILDAFEVVFNGTVLHRECRDVDRSAPSLGAQDPPTRYLCLLPPLLVLVPCPLPASAVLPSCGVRSSLGVREPSLKQLAVVLAARAGGGRWSSTPPRTWPTALWTRKACCSSFARPPPPGFSSTR